MYLGIRPARPMNDEGGPSFSANQRSVDSTYNNNNNTNSMANQQQLQGGASGSSTNYNNTIFVQSVPPTQPQQTTSTTANYRQPLRVALPPNLPQQPPPPPAFAQPTPIRGFLRHNHGFFWFIYNLVASVVIYLGINNPPLPEPVSGHIFEHYRDFSRPAPTNEELRRLVAASSRAQQNAPPAPQAQVYKNTKWRCFMYIFL